MAMSFQKQTKYMNIALVAISVILLIRFLFNHTVDEDRKFSLDADFKEPTLDLPRSYLIFWEFIWLVSIAIGFLWLAGKAVEKANLDREHKIEAFEPKFFKFMVILLIIAAFMTLVVPALFGDKSAVLQFRNSDDAITVEVIASQYQFTFDGELTKTLQQDVKYVFKITTLDTTHGFGLYNDKGLLLGQAQIVPDRTTEFVWRFEETGVYTIRCMEYCGISHDLMAYSGQAVITIV